MISRVVLAIVVAVVVGLVCMFLLGPILLTLSVPIAQIAGSFLVNGVRLDPAYGNIISPVTDAQWKRIETMATYSP